MPDAVAEQFTRIVGLVARASRRANGADDGTPLAEVARELCVSPEQVEQDIRTLTLLGDGADQEWLLSICGWQQGDRVSVSSAGPFRRPVRLSPEEWLAVQVALSMEKGGAALARRLAALAAGRERASPLPALHPPGPTSSPGPWPSAGRSRCCMRARRTTGAGAG